jgi:hypothetical protein
VGVLGNAWQEGVEARWVGVLGTPWQEGEGVEARRVAQRRLNKEASSDKSAGQGWNTYEEGWPDPAWQR